MKGVLYGVSPAIVRDLSMTMNDTALAAHFGVTLKVIRGFRRRHGIPASTAPKKARTLKYAVDQDFFACIDTPEKAYTLGFIVADGCVPSRGTSLKISIHEKDAHILHDIRAAMGCDAPIRVRREHAGYADMNIATLQVWSGKVARDLMALGLLPNKTVSAVYPNMPAHLDPHFIRGYWDGDGSISREQFTAIGTRAVLEGIQSRALAATGRHLRSTTHTSGHLFLYGTRRDKPFLDWLYSEGGMMLRRKYSNYIAYWSDSPYLVSEPST